MGNHGQIELGGVLDGFFIKSAVRTGLPSSEMATIPASAIKPISASSLPSWFLLTAPTGSTLHEPSPFSLVRDGAHDCWVVNGGPGVGHAGNSRDAAPDRSSSAADDIFAIFKAWIAQMGVRIH